MYEPDTMARWSTRTVCLLMICSLGSTTAYAQTSKEKPTRAKLDKKLRRANKLLEYNSITRAIRAFEYIVRHDPEHYAHVYFTLAQLYEYKKKPGAATLCYLAYLEHGWEEEFVSHSKTAIQRLRQVDWRALRVHVNTERPGRILINGYVLKRAATGTTEVVVPQGTYEVMIDVEKHQRDEYEVALRAEPVVISSTPIPMLVHGELTMQVNVPNARVVLLQERADSHKGGRQPLRIALPLQGPVRLPTGTYLLEVVEPSHEPWRRRFRVEDGDLSEFDVQMKRALPNELRYTHVYNADGTPKVPLPKTYDPKVALPKEQEKVEGEKAEAPPKEASAAKEEPAEVPETPTQPVTKR